jgi:hypothetical protein
MSLTSWIVHTITSLAGGRGAAQTHQRKKKSILPVNSAPLEYLEVGQELPDPVQQRRLGKAYQPSPVVMPLELRRRHLYGTGTVGSGKTSFALQLMDHDIAVGMNGGERGVGCMDPEGDLIDRVLKRLCGHYDEAQIVPHFALIDFRQHHTWTQTIPHCVGWNPLRDAGIDPSSAALFCYDCFDDVYQIGPASGELLRYTLLALAHSTSVGKEGVGTLLDIEPFLLEPGFRQEVLSSVTDTTLLRFFRTRFRTLVENPTLVSAILNKISPLTSLPAIRRHLGMRQGTLPLRTLLTQPGTILLCALASNELGNQAASLIGRLLIQSIARSFIRSDRLLDDATGSFFLTLDEFSLFQGSHDLVSEVAGQGRRYGLHLLALHQSAAQLDSKTRSILRNVTGSQIYFACGGGDADTLASELPAPSGESKAILRHWLIQQQPGEAIFAEGGKPIRRIRCHFQPDPLVDRALVSRVRQQALERFGRPLADVEAEIAAHEARTLPGSATKQSVEVIEVVP